MFSKNKGVSLIVVPNSFHNIYSRVLGLLELLHLSIGNSIQCILKPYFICFWIIIVCMLLLYM